MSARRIESPTEEERSHAESLALLRAALNDGNRARLDAMLPADRLWLIEQAFTDGILRFRGAPAPSSRSARVCAWCQLILTAGSLPATHTICPACEGKLLAPDAP